MKKNLFTILLIFVIPMIAYFILSKSDATYAEKSSSPKSQIIKFSSKMCIDCKKIGKVLEEVMPKYENEVSLIEINVQDHGVKTKKMIDDYNITLVPTLIFINSKQVQTKRIEGYIDKKQMIKEIETLINE